MKSLIASVAVLFMVIGEGNGQGTMGGGSQCGNLLDSQNHSFRK